MSAFGLAAAALILASCATAKLVGTELTPEAVQAFAHDQGLAKSFVFLIGGAAQLQAVWSAYGHPDRNGSQRGRRRAQ